MEDFWAPEGFLQHKHEEETEKTEEVVFHVGLSVGQRVARALKCKTCGGVEFFVAQAEYYTAIKCTTCLWEACVHDG